MPSYVYEVIIFLKTNVVFLLYGTSLGISRLYILIYYFSRKFDIDFALLKIDINTQLGKSC